jgi:Protein of unknown function (DUF3102)
MPRERLPNRRLSETFELEVSGLKYTASVSRFAHLAAGANAAQNFLEHALAAGDALIHAKEQVQHGGWLPWLKLCGLSADTAERYMKLARHRAELNSAGVRNLSLSVALRLIGKPQSTNSKPKKKTKLATSFNALAWWTNASRNSP